MEPNHSTRASYEFGPFRFDAVRRLLYRSGELVPLTPKVADTLWVLLSREGEVVERAELIRLVWPDTFVEDGGLARNISMLRKALGDDAEGCQFIETIPKRGYRFAAPIKEQNGQAGDLPYRHWRRIAAVVAALAILSGVAAYLAYRTRRSGPRPAVIAVLPLRNLSNIPDQAYFSEGMTDMLVTELARSGVRVIAPASVRRIRPGAPLAEIGRQLGADSVVQGTVLASERRVRINAQLADVKTGRLLWAESYGGELRDVLGLQAEVAGAIAREVSTAARSSPKPPRSPLVAPAAFDAYLKGRYFWNKRTEAGLRKAIEYFTQAAAADPAYAAPHAGLADAYALLGSTGYDAIPPRQTMPLAKAAARRALTLDGSLAEAHTSLAYCLMVYDWDLDAAEKEFQEALRLDPAYATAYHWYAHLALARGRIDQAATRFKEASRLDPLSLPVGVGIGWYSYFGRRYDEAIGQYRKTLELDPDFALAHQTLGLALERKGSPREAIGEFRRAVALTGSPVSVALLGYGCASAGSVAEAQAQLRMLDEMASKRYVPAIDRVLVYLGLGDRDRAAAWFRKAVAERSEYVIYLPLDPLFDAVRNDSRFQVILMPPEAGKKVSGALE